MADDAEAVESRYTDPTDKSAAQRRLADVVPRLTADQAEDVLQRLREGGQRDTTPTVEALIERLQATGGVRRAGKARKWFGDAGRTAEARQSRLEQGNRKQQKIDYQAYIHDLANQLEAANRGGRAVRRLPGDGAGSRSSLTTGGGVPSLEAVLNSSPATIKARLSPESMELLAKIGRPLSFDAWRYENLGARDAQAVASWKRRNAGYFSEYG